MATRRDGEKRRPLHNHPLYNNGPLYNNDFRARVRGRGRFCLGAMVVGLLLASLIASVGCESLNQDQNNKRWWFPSLQSPGYLNPDHELYTPEGSDPYMDATVGPKSLQSRPPGYEVPRSRVQQLMDSQPKK
ncbi:MAG: hypothetical protein Q4G68_14015 [Planctomycetia bacterium]|nr:hypothetical protein [Planctomycetia bacterium]